MSGKQPATITSGDIIKKEFKQAYTLETRYGSANMPSTLSMTILYPDGTKVQEEFKGKKAEKMHELYQEGSTYP